MDTTVRMQHPGTGEVLDIPDHAAHSMAAMGWQRLEPTPRPAAKRRKTTGSKATSGKE